jgi:hypothetical protein
LPFGKQLIIDAEKSWTAAPNFLACGAPVEITFSGHDVSAVCRSERCPGANLGGSLDLAVFGNRGGVSSIGPPHLFL